MPFSNKLSMFGVGYLPPLYDISAMPKSSNNINNIFGGFVLLNEWQCNIKMHQKNNETIMSASNQWECCCFVEKKHLDNVGSNSGWTWEHTTDWKLNANL